METTNERGSGKMASPLREQFATAEIMEAIKDDLLIKMKEVLKEILTGLPMRKKWLKSAEVRRLLGLSPGTLQNLRVNGTLPYTKIGSIVFYDYDDIQKMLTENRVHNRPVQAASEDRFKML